MKKENYLTFLEKTIDNYSIKNLKYLKNEFINSKIAIEGKEQLSLGMVNIVNITELELKEQIKKCLKENEIAVKIFEKWEYEKDYKYSVIFEACNFKEIFKKLKEIQDEDFIENNLIENDSFSKYKKIEIYNNIFLKFCLGLSSFHPQTGEELLQKYVFMVVLHKEEELVEFRFDTIGKNFQKEQITYPIFIGKIKKYLEEALKTSLTPLDLNFLITIAKDQKNELKLIAQAMKLATGGNAQLDVGNNQEYVLPLIGELKNLLVEYKDELEKISKLKEGLDEFLYEKEEMSDYPWVELMWEDEIKTRNKRVKIFFNYKQYDYSLIQHYYSNVLIGMERMNYVIKYIKQNKKSS